MERVPSLPLPSRTMGTIERIGMRHVVHFNKELAHWTVIETTENYNYSKTFQYWRNQHSGGTFNILLFHLEELACVRWGERNNLSIEDVLLVRRQEVIEEHLPYCDATNSFHYKLFHEKGVENVPQITALLNSGWRLGNNGELTNRPFR